MNQDKIYKFRGWKVYLQKKTYSKNGTLAILMVDATDPSELIGVVTVNLNSPLQSDKRAFVDTNNLSGIGEWLEKNKVATFTGVCQASGFCSYPLMEFSI